MARLRPRLAALDGLRGLAIALMMLDHVLLVVAPQHWLRYTLTRAALPMFMLVAGHLWRPRFSRRLLEVFAAGIAATAFGAPLGIGQPDVLLVILAAVLLMTVADRLHVPPCVVLILGILQPTTWALGYTGYEVGTVVALLVVGRIGQLGPIVRWFEHSPRLLIVAGRYPLTLYVGHLAALWLVFR